MPLRASSSRKRRLTQRNCAASSAETNGSGVRRTCLDSLAVTTVAGAEKVPALSPGSPPVATSSCMVMIDLSGSFGRDAKTGVGCRCCKTLERALDIDGNESTVRRGACRLEDAVFSRTPKWRRVGFMLSSLSQKENLHRFLARRRCGFDVLANS